MARGGGFVGGLIAGTLVIIAGAVALRYLPAPERPAEGVRDELLAQLPPPSASAPRALPEELRTGDCDLAEHFQTTLKKTVSEPGGPDGDFPTPEAWLDALLDGPHCKEAGKVRTITERELERVASLVARVAARARSEGDRETSRAWGSRLWALGQDILVSDPEDRGGVGARIVAIGAGVMADSLVDADRESAVQAGVLAQTLSERMPTGGWVVGRVAGDRLKRGLTSPAILIEGGDALTKASEEATVWWAALATAVDEPGAELPKRPSGPVVDLMVDRGAHRLVEDLRTARAARLAVLLLATSRVAEGEGCAPPWTDSPPLDPVTGGPVGWDAEACKLTVGSRTWKLQPTSR